MTLTVDDLNKIFLAVLGGLLALNAKYHFMGKIAEFVLKVDSDKSTEPNTTEQQTLMVAISSTDRNVKFLSDGFDEMKKKVEHIESTQETLRLRVINNHATAMNELTDIKKALNELLEKNENSQAE